MSQNTFTKDIDEKIDDLKNAVFNLWSNNAHSIRNLERDETSSIKLVRDQIYYRVQLDEKFLALFNDLKIEAEKNSDEQITYTFPRTLVCNNQSSDIYIDTVTLNRKDDTYTLISNLGRLRTDFKEIQGFKVMGREWKEYGPVKAFKADQTVVLQEILRMNGFDELIKDFDKVKLNIRPAKDGMGELILYSTLHHEPSRADVEGIICEFSNIVKIYQHFLHYVLDVEELKKSNPNVYTGTKDSAIFYKHEKEKPTSKSKQNVIEKDNNFEIIL